MPSPGRTRSAQPRVGSRQSFTCTPAKRPLCSAISSNRSGVFQRCQTSNWMPSAGEPTSSIRSTASPIVLTIDQFSIPSRWNGSSASVRSSLCASAATSRSPSTTVSRSPGPVRQTTAAGPNGARTWSERSSESIRSRGSSGPGSNGRGWIEGIAGTALAAPRPLARNCSREAASSFISQMPIPSTPASAYACRSAANDAPTVLTCEIENLRTPMPRSYARV